MREWITIPLLATAVMLTAWACSATDEPAAEEGSEESRSESSEMSGATESLAFQVLAKGNYGRAARGSVSEAPRNEPPRIEVARTESELERLWSAHVETGPVPDVDMESRVVLFLLVPLRPTGGYGVEPTGAELAEGRIRVEADLVEPKEGMMTTQALTAPYAVVSIERPAAWGGISWVDDGRIVARSDVREE